MIAGTDDSFVSLLSRPDVSLKVVHATFPVAPPVPAEPPAGTTAALPVRPAAPSEPLAHLETPGDSWLAAWWRAGWPGAAANLYLRAAAAKRLQQVDAALPPLWSLVVIDGWRSRRLQDAIFEHWKHRGSMAEPTERTPGVFAPHVTGGAVDVTLAYVGEPLLLGQPYMGDRDVSVGEAADVAERLRRVLYWRMRDAGFCGHPTRWWQFEFGTARWAAATGCDPLYGIASLT